MKEFELFINEKIKFDEITSLDDCKAVIGIDIGSTSISAVVINADENTVIETYTVDNDSSISVEPDFSEFDADKMTDKAKAIAEYLIKAYPNAVSIGITGQMHGVVYLDKNGKAVSPLYNWQDGRGNRKLPNGKTYAQEIFDLTGYKVYSGYGFSTLYYNKINGLEPQNAYTFCTIMDYLAVKLAGLLFPVIHPSNAASLGLFNLKDKAFDKDAIKKLGLDHLEIPTVAEDYDNIIDKYFGVSVSVAIGDNQASIFGSVKPEKNNSLVNFGTGSQISAVTDEYREVNENLELRPYLFGKYLICGCALCGGKAYSILQKFFSAFAKEVDENHSSCYDIMDALAEKAYKEKTCLNVSTLFCGTRNNPDLMGEISGITDKNFTPENLCLGFLQGMVDELKTYFDYMNVTDVEGLTASGNAVQKTPVLQKLLVDTFGFELSLTDSREEASIGAAVFAGISCGKLTYEQISKIIKYK